MTGTQPLKPYHCKVQAASQRSPSLQNLNDFLASSDPINRQQCRIACLPVHSDGSSSVHALDDNGLATLLQDPYPETKSFAGRILVVEDLSIDVIEMVGSSLHIDPSFFAIHLHSLRREVSPRRPFVPTRIGQQDCIQTRYHHPFFVEGTRFSGNFYMHSAVRRKVVITATNGELLGWVQGKISTLCRMHETRPWLCMKAQLTSPLQLN